MDNLDNMKYIKSYGEFINENLNEGKVKKADLAQALVDADKKDWGSIADTPYIDNKEGQITITVHAGDSTVKKYLNDMMKKFGFKTKFDYVARNGNTHDYTWWLNESNINEAKVTTFPDKFTVVKEAYLIGKRTSFGGGLGQTKNYTSFDWEIRNDRFNNVDTLLKGEYILDKSSVESDYAEYARGSGEARGFSKDELDVLVGNKQIKI